MLENSAKNVKRCKQFVKYLTLLCLCVFAINCSQPDGDFFSEIEEVSLSEDAININTADAEKLETLPNVGVKTAAKIVKHREKFGEFRRPEHLLLVEGISDKRFRTMRKMIKVE